jgi:hypothetical protein
MTSALLTPEFARRLAVADAQAVVFSIAGELGQARKKHEAERVPALEKKLEDARTRLYLAKMAAA